MSIQWQLHQQRLVLERIQTELRRLENKIDNLNTHIESLQVNSMRQQHSPRSLVCTVNFQTGQRRVWSEPSRTN